MSSWIKNITQLSDDVLGLLEDKVKHSRQKQYWKNKFTSIIKDLNEETPVFYYKDGEGELCAYYLWEFNCSESEDWGSLITPFRFSNLTYQELNAIQRVDALFQSQVCDDY